MPTPAAISLAQLQKIMPLAGKRAALHLLPLNAAAAAYGIETMPQWAAWLAQLAVESGELRYAKEIWGPTPAQLRYERDFTQEWRAGLPKGHRNRLAYELGNSEKGDGKRFMGRGDIETTGRGNYAKVSMALFGDLRLLDTPELLEEPGHAADSAAWFWQSHGLNALADAGDFDEITRRINGGQNGRDERRAYWGRAKKVLGVG